ncbi:MAG: hypothetical protein HYY13_10310 [Nitrospirae bacterium]|nr:hypothetical protein [Nitrospirota bacterium]
MKRSTLILLVILSLIVTAAVLNTVRGKRLGDVLLILPPNATDAEKGEVVFGKRCGPCHHDGTASEVPSVAEAYRLRGPEWVRRYVDPTQGHRPESRVPGLSLTPEEDRLMMAYLAARGTGEGRIP